MDLIKHIYGHCFNPQKVWIVNPVTKEKELRDVPCGKCYHCRITKVNEWCTRMVLESKARKYTYFVTLTYSDRCEHTDVFAETYPQRNSCNSFGKSQNTPLVICKSHLQKFFKRLRKNTCIKFKYFAVGEYGHTYGRPHYHFILWSDEPVSKLDIYKAWSTTDYYGHRVVIGNIDYNLLSSDHMNLDNNLTAFKYVCKYLQKGSFDFENLPTADYHRKLRTLLFDYYDGYVKGTPSKSSDTLSSLYAKRFAPFMLCSKSPAIGFEYLQENLVRFSRGDFRLFGLPPDSTFILPRYFVRKAREMACPYSRVVHETGNLRSNTSISDLVSVLVEVQNCIDFMEDFSAVQPILYKDYDTGKYTVENSSNIGERTFRLFPSEFMFYDRLHRVWYEFNGNSYDIYKHQRGEKELVGIAPVSTVISQLQSTYSFMIDNLLRPMDMQRKAKEKILAEEAFATYGDSWQDVQDTYRQNLLNYINDRQRKYFQTKNKF